MCIRKIMNELAQALSRKKGRNNMAIRTNLDQVKAVAHALLYTDVAKTSFSPAIVQHPFTSSGIVAIKQGGQIQMLDITSGEAALSAWQKSVAEQIDKASKPFEIYMMVNKPYGLTFLKYAAPYLSGADFSHILANAWVRSENPNNDANVSKEKLRSMFRRAEKNALMSEEELSQFNALPETVTVYRGVTSFNAGNILALSWTLNPETAEWFAKRFEEDGTVYEASIGKEHIFALFNGRNEDEVVVDPTYLEDIHVLQGMDEGPALEI